VSKACYGERRDGEPIFFALDEDVLNYCYGLRRTGLCWGFGKELNIGFGEESDKGLFG